LYAVADCSIVNKRQSILLTDEIQVKIADLGNACWTVSYSLDCILITVLLVWGFKVSVRNCTLKLLFHWKYVYCSLRSYLICCQYLQLSAYSMAC